MRKGLWAFFFSWPKHGKPIITSTSKIKTVFKCLLSAAIKILHTAAWELRLRISPVIRKSRVATIDEQ